MATKKQKLAAEKIVENHGNISKTMLEVGYAENTAHNPRNLTESKGWGELMDSNIPDELLMEKHRELLFKEEVVTKNNMTTGEVDVIETGQIDVTAVRAGLDMGYKLKGKYAPEKRAILTLDATPRARELADKLIRLHG